MNTAYERSLWIPQQNPENDPGLAPWAVKGGVEGDVERPVWALTH
jgi:hypothetical protein